VVEKAQDPVRAHHRFVHYHRVEIDRLTWKGNFSLDLRPVLGGLGFRIPEGVGYHTTFQRRLASFLKKKFLADPARKERISMIQVNKPSQLQRKDTRYLVLDPSPIGPYAPGLMYPMDLTIRSPPLMDVTMTEMAEFKIRYPNLKEFRKEPSRRMGDAELTAPLGRVMQIGGGYRQLDPCLEETHGVLVLTAQNGVSCDRSHVPRAQEIALLMMEALRDL
jgi:hypothetical protein